MSSPTSRRPRRRGWRAATVQRAASSRNHELVDGELADHAVLAPAAEQQAVDQREDAPGRRATARDTCRWRRNRTRRSGSCARRCVSVTAVSSSAEITETTLEASMSRMNWLPSAGKTVRSAGTRTMKRKICARLQVRAPAGLDLAARHRLDAGAHDLGRIGAEIDDHRQQRGLVGRQPEAERRQAEIDEQELDEERRVADRLDVAVGDRAQERASARLRPARPAMPTTRPSTIASAGQAQT